MNEDEITSRLEELGGRAGRGPSDRFADNLESHLRVTAAQMNLAVEGGPESRKTQALWRPALGMALATVVVLAGTLVLWRSGSPAEALVMGVTQDTEVILPSGSSVMGVDGMPLPEGTRIEVGPAGSARIADVVLASDTVAVIRDGRLEIITDRAPPTSTPVESDRQQQTDRPVSTTGRDQPGPTAAEPGGSSSGTATSRQADTPTEAPGRSDIPALQIELVARPPGENGVSLVWSVAANDVVAGWEVRALRGDAARTVAVLRDPQTTQITVAPPDRGSVRYWVVAKDSSGAELGSSNQITLQAS